MNGALKAIGFQFKDLENDEVTLKKLQKLSQSAKGQLSAIQAASAIATHQTHTIKKLQETVMIQTNMQGQYYAMQNEKNVLKQAGRAKFMEKRATTNPNNDVAAP